VSILAEIVQMRASAAKSGAKPAATLGLNVIQNEAKDPICGMMIERGKQNINRISGKDVLLLLCRLQTEV
jgi:hypothetical protein